MRFPPASGGTLRNDKPGSFNAPKGFREISTQLDKELAAELLDLTSFNAPKGFRKISTLNLAALLPISPDGKKFQCPEGLS